MTKFIKKIWHDLYYKIAADSLVRFALTCREVTRNIDLNDKKTVRHKLHLSLCQRCADHDQFSNWLKINSYPLRPQLSSEELRQANEKLLIITRKS